MLGLVGLLGCTFERALGLVFGGHGMICWMGNLMRLVMIFYKVLNDGLF